MIPVIEPPFAGDVVSVPFGPYRHVGIFTGMSVISNSAWAQGVVEETLEEFVDGRECQIDGYLGALHPAEVLLRARAAPRRPYHLFTWNCEHFVRYCHGVEETSPQLGATLLVALVGVSALLVAKQAR